MQTGVQKHSELPGLILGLALLALTVSSVGIVNAQQSPSQKNAAPLATPDPSKYLGPQNPTRTIRNSDGTTTSVWVFGDGSTRTQTVNSKGEPIINVLSRSDSIYGVGGQLTRIEKFSPDGNTLFIEEQRDSQGVVRHLVKSDSGSIARDEFHYGPDGNLVKATVSRDKPDEAGHMLNQYRPSSSNSSGGEQYNLATGKWEPVSADDWPKIAGRLDTVQKDISSIRDQFNPDQVKPVEKPVAAEPKPEKKPEPEDDLAAVREEAAKHPMELVRSPGPLAPPSDPFKVREEQQREAEKQLDPCLIGTWRSVSIEATLLNEKGGGEGIVITINEDHSVTIDYTAMTPMRGGNAKNVWRGIASGHMWASKGRAGITSTERAEAYLMTNGQRNPQGNYKDLGPAKTTRYECNETTLVTESASHRITYTRQKE
jgi:hypothetical protein